MSQTEAENKQVFKRWQKFDKNQSKPTRWQVSIDVAHTRSMLKMSHRLCRICTAGAILSATRQPQAGNSRCCGCRVFWKPHGTVVAVNKSHTGHHRAARDRSHDQPGSQTHRWGTAERRHKTGRISQRCTTSWKVWRNEGSLLVWRRCHDVFDYRGGNSRHPITARLAALRSTSSAPRRFRRQPRWISSSSGNGRTGARSRARLLQDGNFWVELLCHRNKLPLLCHRLIELLHQHVLCPCWKLILCQSFRNRTACI